MKNLVILVVIVALAWFVISSLLTTNVMNVLQEVETGKLIGVLLITPHQLLDKDVRGAWPHSIKGQYISLIDDQKIPSDGSEKIFKQASDDDIKRCGEPVTVGLLARAWKPTVGFAEAGGKTKLQIIGLRAVGSVGCEVGELEKAAGYDDRFKPGDPGFINLWNSPQCIVRLNLLGQKPQVSSCLDSGYEPY